MAIDRRWAAARKVLAVRLDNLGDLLMTTPALAALRAGLPQARITLLTSPSAAALAPHLPAVDAVLPFAAAWVAQGRDAGAGERVGARERALADELRLEGFDAAVIFTVCTQSPLPAALLCRLAGIPLCLAHCRENPYALLSDWIRETDVPAQGMRHEVQRQLDLVAALGCHAPDTRLAFAVLPADRRHAQARLRAAGWDAAGPYVVLHPGASAPSRRYPPELFAQAARALAVQTGWPVVLVGGAGDEAMVHSVQAHMGCPTPLRLAAHLPLGELAALIEGAALVLCNNSAPAHIAAALQTPVVVLYALTNPQHTPWRGRARVLSHPVPCRNCLRSQCPEGHHACLREVRPEQVVQAALALVGGAAVPERDGAAA